MKNDIEKLYEEYYSDLYQYIYMLTLNKYDTEDIIHNTFVRAISGISKVKKFSSIKSWLLKIAHNECINYFRKSINTVDIDTLTVTIENDIEKQLCVNEDIQKILEYIHQQNEPIKSLLCLRLLDNYSFLQISEILNKTESWCRVTFFREKNKLIEYLN